MVAIGGNYGGAGSAVGLRELVDRKWGFLGARQLLLMRYLILTSNSAELYLLLDRKVGLSSVSGSRRTRLERPAALR